MGKQRLKGKFALRLAQSNLHDEQFKKSPHTFVIKRGKVGPLVELLVSDMRRVMQPYTASNLKVRKKNALKDFINMAGPLNVSHLIIFTQSEQSVYMRLMKMPRGPTITFKVEEYSLHKDVIASLRKPQLEPKQFAHAPLLVVQGLSGEGKQLQLAATMLQAMFPTINVDTVNLDQIRRCVLFNYDAEKDCMEFRHYNIRAVPVGVNRGIKKLLKTRVPDLSRLNDISEFMERGDVSESEAEEGSELTLPQRLVGRGNKANTQSAVRLTELGPRLRLTLVKVEEGACEGRVLYHKYVQKSDEQERRDKKRRLGKVKVKVERRREQDKNIARKQQAKDDNKTRSLEGMKRAQDNGEGVEALETAAEVPSDDDLEYYREQVGQDPEEELFSRRSKRAKVEKKPARTEKKEAKEKQAKERNISHERMVKNLQKKKLLAKKRKVASRKRKSNTGHKRR